MTTRLLKLKSIQLQVIEAGSGPLVLLVHGFPELAISWNAQIRALSEAGYRVVAPDMRGYGGSDKPADTAAYCIHNLVSDLIEVVEAMDETEAVIIGHDWGASVAWQAALMRPDVFRAVAALSVPFQPRRERGPPTEVMAYLSRKAGMGDLYINRFQAAGAHLPYEADTEQTLRKLFWAFDGATPTQDQTTGFIPENSELLDLIKDDPPLPPWMDEAHFQAYVRAFGHGGFKGPFDWYRNIDRNWEMTQDFQDRRITVPALFMVGERDPTRHYSGTQEDQLSLWLNDLRKVILVKGAGHWLQQERPDLVNAALLDFLSEL